MAVWRHLAGGGGYNRKSYPNYEDIETTDQSLLLFSLIVINLTIILNITFCHLGDLLTKLDQDNNIAPSFSNCQHWQ